MKNVGEVLLRQIEEMKQWLGDPFNEAVLYQEPLAEVTDHLDKPRDDSAAVLAVGFLNMETWVGASGAVAVLGSYPDGWHDLHRALEFKALSVCLYRHLFEIDQRRNREPRGRALHATLGLSHALALNDAVLSTKFGEALMASFRDGGLSAVGSSPLDSFMLSVWSRAFGDVNLDSQIAQEDFGVYSGIDSKWEDMDEFGEAVRAACDYHVQRTLASDDPSVEFDRYPYNIFPAEILAVMKVRGSEGRVSGVAHPLMETALALPPHSLPSVSDTLLTRAWEFVETIRLAQ